MKKRSRGGVVRTGSGIGRRGFLAGAAGMGGVLVVPSSRVAFGFAANERLNLGIVGVGGYASAAAFVPAIHTYENVTIAALCDVDQRKVAPAFKLWEERARAWPTSGKAEERRGAGVYERLAERRPPLFEDYRVMLEKMGREIDAVVVATPDHTHAPASAAALRAGKPVFCEKPLTITARESRGLYELAVEHRVATSMGNQGTQSGPFRRGLELIREGAIGAVRDVHVFFARGGRDHRRPPQGAQAVPAELNWDLWLGTVAWREYHPGWIARTHWRETSTGELGNFFPHSANLAFMALEVAEVWKVAGARITVEAECSGVNRLSFPAWERIRWEVPARKGADGREWGAVRFTWHHGPDYAPGSREALGNLLRERGASEEEVKKLLPYAGALIVGSEGVIATDSHNVNIALLPKGKFEGVAVDRPKEVRASRGHYRDWLEACRGGEAPWARFEYAARFNEFLTLGDVATRWPGEKLEYDPVEGRVVNHREGDAALGYAYREGWPQLGRRAEG